ncbi:MAG: TonB-dependent receptor [Lewinellaceae bacterium]|nr:TonB-dependent receptor [Lewinellaceae bacterium]
MNVRHLLIGLLTLQAMVLSAQTAIIRGKVTDSESNAPVIDAAVVINGTGKFAATANDGSFELQKAPQGEQRIVVTHAGYKPLEQTIKVPKTGKLVLELSLVRDPNTDGRPVDIPTITLDEAEEESEGAGEVANLLHASRDVFQNISAYGWSFFRFRERGYDSEFFPLYLNGVSINDPETGIAFYSDFGGLNDVLRNRESSIGMDAADFTLTEIGGATLLDTRASVQRKQIRASYAVSNRSYTNRVMLTASSGLMPGGWAVSASASRRWAQEGYFDATFYDGYSYFLSVDKKFGSQHNLNLTVLGAPTKRGRSGDTFQEMFDLAGSIRYNPFWGYWNGEKRNAYVRYGNKPIDLSRYDWTPNNRTALMFTSYGQSGKRGDTRLDWFNANNPMPDYNRRLPSSFEDPTTGAEWAQLLRDNEDLRQLDWAAMYEANTINTSTVEDANGSGTAFTGKRSQYVVADFRSDSRELGSNLTFRHQLNSRLALQAGGKYQYYLGENFKVLDDLLGGDYILDWDRFAQQDQPENPLARDNDLRIPNHIVREGNTYGYNYNENIRSGGGWLQLQGNLRKLSGFAGVELNTQTMWREGKMQNGRFPNESLGESDKLQFNTYGLKGGVTWKLNGRNYLYANGFSGTRAPLFQDIFLSPRIRNQHVDNPTVYKIQSVEGGYQLRAPNMKARVTGYFTTFEDQIDAFMLFQPSVGVFGTMLQTGINRQHAGVEMAIEAKPIVGWTFSAATNLGKYIYTNRPSLYLTLDNTAELVLDGVTVYQKNYYVPRTPQTTASVSAKYESRRFWFASLTANWADNLWYDFDRSRRTAGFVETFEPGSEIWHTVLDQEKAPAAFTLDFFGGKSWRIKTKYFLYLNAGINNILNNQNVIISGRDAYRNGYANDSTDPRLYTSELIYAPGLNYFIGLTLRM